MIRPICHIILEFVNMYVDLFYNFIPYSSLCFREYLDGLVSSSQPSVSPVDDILSEVSSAGGENSTVTGDAYGLVLPGLDLILSHLKDHHTLYIESASLSHYVTYIVCSILGLVMMICCISLLAWVCLRHR